VLLPQLLLTLVLLVVCSFAPGFLFVRRLRWSGLEKLCGAIGLSLILLWLAAWAVYVFSIPYGHLGLALACGAAAIPGARDAWHLFRGHRVRRAALGYAFLLAWTLVILAIVRNYSGASWSGDWVEHFQRTLYFLHHFPKDTPVYGGYLLPARPPMMNVLAAFFLGLTTDRFEIFQLVFVFLNLLLFLPCCLLLPVVAKVRRIPILPLVGIFAMNPVVMQNATYTWTKSLTAFFVLLAIHLYLSAWRKRDTVRITAAFLALAAGLLVHYSAGPYIAFFALHYLLFVWRARPAKTRELAVIALSSGLLLFTWFSWSITAHGAKATFASNTSVSTAAQYNGSNLEKIVRNISDSILPRIVWDSSSAELYQQPYAPGVLRDKIFIFYQTNLIFSMGLIGGPLVVCFVIGAIRSRSGPRAERIFWECLIAFAVLVGLAVVGERDSMGTAHLTLVPMEILGLTLLAARFTAKRWIAGLIIAGCTIDFSAGVLLHARMEHLENTEQTTYYTGLSFANGKFYIGSPGPDSLSAAAWVNWKSKHFRTAWLQWQQSGEAFHRGEPALEKAHAGLQAAIAQRLQEDDKIWHGWYRNHGGEIQFLGDSAGGGNAASILLILMAVGLLAAMAKYAAKYQATPQAMHAPRVSVPAAAKPTSSRSRRK
jgi:hypothetical protein